MAHGWFHIRGLPLGCGLPNWLYQSLKPEKLRGWLGATKAYGLQKSLGGARNRAPHISQEVQLYVGPKGGVFIH